MAGLRRCWGDGSWRWRCRAIATLLATGVLIGGCYSGRDKAGAGGTADSGTDGGGSGENDTGETAGGGIDVDQGPAVGRRLIREEYFNSIHVTLGVQLDPAGYDLPEDYRLPSGFRNTSADLLLSPKRIEVYDEISAAVAEQVDIDAVLATHASCTELESQCTGAFVADLGLLLLRRPVSGVERDLYIGLFDVAIDEGQGFADGARLVLRSMLQSPRFIYRLESQDPGQADANGMRRIDEYEFATRLSFLVWNAAPDLELMRLADAGDLSGSVDAQVERLLDHPHAQRALRQYIEQWLYLESTSSNLLLREQMQEETYRLFERIVWEENTDFMQAFVSQQAELSPELAEFYGLQPQAGASAVYDLSALPERIGVTTNAAVMAARTINPESSIIDRGLFVLNDLLCESIPPPEGEALENAIDENKIPPDSGLSQRERFAMQSEDPLCAGCHQVFDPLGLPFEQFGPAGEFMTEDNFGNPLSGQSTVEIGDMAGEYANVAEFSQALSTSQTVTRCMVQKSLQHAYGRVLTTKDDPLVDDLLADFDADSRSYRTLLVAIALHPQFRLVEAQTE